MGHLGVNPVRDHAFQFGDFRTVVDGKWFCHQRCDLSMNAWREDASEARENEISHGFGLVKTS
jgi:hypothetical protein